MEAVFFAVLACYCLYALARARKLRQQAAAAGIPTSLPIKVISAVLKADQQGATAFAVVTDPERAVGPLSSIGWELRDHKVLPAGGGAASRTNSRKSAKHMLSFTRVKAPNSSTPGLSPAVPNHQAVVAGKARMQRRKEARELAQKDPVLARDLRIGRPDLARDYDDGGLVDVNRVPAATMVSALELTEDEAAAVDAARAKLGKFTSAEELSAYAQLAPARVDEISDLLWFS